MSVQPGSVLPPCVLCLGERMGEIPGISCLRCYGLGTDPDSQAPVLSERQAS